MTSRRGPITTVDFSGPVFPARYPAFAKNLLALVALGTGKGSSIHRIWRDAMGVSYRQEAVLWPDAKGFRPRLMLAMLSGKEDEKLPDRLKQALIDDVGKWNFETLERARGMAEGFLMNAIEISPLYLEGSSPTGFSLEDRTFLAAYWAMKVGSDKGIGEVAASVRDVSLEDLKSWALNFLKLISVWVVTGSR